MKRRGFFSMLFAAFGIAIVPKNAPAFVDFIPKTTHSFPPGSIIRVKQGKNYKCGPMTRSVSDELLKNLSPVNWKVLPKE